MSLLPVNVIFQGVNIDCSIVRGIM